jgi:hypothetical protein
LRIIFLYFFIETEVKDFSRWFVFYIMDFSITGKKFGTTSPAVSIPSKPLTKEKATSVHTTTQAKNGPKPYLHNSSIKPMINRPGNQQSYLPKDNRQK